MVAIENECVGCPGGMGCMGRSCPNRNVERFYCDSCGAEDELYYFDDSELCLSCIIGRLDRVETERM